MNATEHNDAANRTRREINFVPTGILSAAPAVFCPYLDPDFVAFCVSLPYEITKDQQLHNDAIARAYPDFTHVPFEEGFTAAAPQRSGLGHKLRVTRDAGRIGRALVPGAGWRTARALLSRGKALNPGPHEMYALNAAFLDGLDAARAQDLLGMAEALTADRPTRLVSDRWRPDAGEPG